LGSYFDFVKTEFSRNSEKGEWVEKGRSAIEEEGEEEKRG
jgi:hypothetical protein